MKPDDLLQLLDAYMRLRLADAKSTLDMCGIRVENQRQYAAWLRLESAWIQQRGK